jgi:SAM-dependent methyltransferase
MSSADLDNATLRQLVINTVLQPGFRRGTFGGRVNGPALSPWVRVVVRPVEIRTGLHLQFSYFDSKKCITKNSRGEDIRPRLEEILDIGFASIHLGTLGEEFDIRTTKRGKILLGRRKVHAPAAALPQPHNRVKDVPLSEAKSAKLLNALGMLTRNGNVRTGMQAKYAQINEFLKHLLHVLDDADLRSLGRPVEILDCGCGSSFLTIAAGYYLNEVLGIPARVMGVDINEEVIRKSAVRASRLGTENLTFANSRIDAVAATADVVIALHACDTATDEAIAQAVAKEAKLLLSVPCCHHDLNKSLRPEGPAAVLRPLIRHGILLQRTADLVTDAFRALALRIMGYRTDVVEFISTEHTARNLMIRAIRALPAGDPAFVDEYREMCRFWGVTPHIETALGAAFQRLLVSRPRSS